jgi:hypothetical protein
VKEMDHMYSHGFTSSFLVHHLATSPTVSAIPDYMADKGSFVQLPDNGPEVTFISRVNLSDTGATVMVSNAKGEIHGAVPTKARCGTAMTGSKAPINELGTWMI